MNKNVFHFIVWSFLNVPHAHLLQPNENVSIFFFAGFASGSLGL